MKRRVSRAHKNKHELRVLSAANNLPLDQFHVLVDASFLRAILLSYWQEYESVYKSRPSAGDYHATRTSSSTDKRFISAYQYLRDSVDEAFASSKVGGGSKVQVQRNSTQATTAIFYYHVPETARTLRRLLGQGQASPDEKDTSHAGKPNAPGKAPQKQSGWQGSKKRHTPLDATRIPEEVVGNLLSRLQRREAESAASTSGPRNEGKAIADLVLSQPREGGGSFYFVATQNHDVRKLLPAGTGILRWTRQPNGVWLEQNGKEGVPHGGVTGAMPTLFNDAAHAGATRTTSSGPRLSQADIAFMRHIGRSDHLVRAPTAHPKTQPRAQAPKAAQEGGDDGVKEGAQSAEPEKQRSKRKRVHGGNPNPLAMKKKQKKEVFRIS